MKQIRHNQLVTLFFVLFASIVLAGCNSTNTQHHQQTFPMPTSTLQVHFLNVGKADCILIQNQGKNLLIDTGYKENYSDIEAYLRKQNVSKIHRLILTHPHKDHIGSAKKILKNFDIDTVYMTDINPHTKIYNALIDQLNKENLTPVYPTKGDSFPVGEATFTFLGPVTQYDDINSMSLVVRCDFGSNSFLFAGDCTEEAEQDMLDHGSSLKAQVLKVGHHGRKDSSSSVFLHTVKPSYSIISCDSDDEHGCPHTKTIARLKGIGSTVYRTDQSGIITATCDGTKITWTTEN